MWPESAEQNRPLRSGLTTGCCATACCVAAASALLLKQHKTGVTVTLPRGREVDLEISSLVTTDGCVRATTVKDAGDDPDVTHGACIFVELELKADPGVEFVAGEGVGVVTRKGLLLDVGEPAINPVPRQMMQQHLQAIADEAGYAGGFRVRVGVENGEQLALKTMNGRLGIRGGLSILGTTGIVRPFSCSAYIASIHQGIDVAVSNGCQHIAASTGSSSEGFIADYYGLPEMALIEMGDFVGALFKYLKKVPVKKLSLCGGFGKISKLANAAMDLHSKSSSIDFTFLGQLAQRAGASSGLLELVEQANTSHEVLLLCQQQGIDIGCQVARKAWQVARRKIPENTELEIFVIDRDGRLVGTAADHG